MEASTHETRGEGEGEGEGEGMTNEILFYYTTFVEKVSFIHPTVLRNTAT